MKTISHLALGLALATGATGLTLATPAVAQKKDDKKAPAFKLSPAVIKVAQPAQAALAVRQACACILAMNPVPMTATRTGGRAIIAPQRRRGRVRATARWCAPRHRARARRRSPCRRNAAHR